MQLAEQAAVVTGAARGIGRGIALRLADEGADVIVADIEGDAAQGTVSEIRRKGRRALAVPCDVTDQADVQAMVRSALDEFGRVDILVNNAGVGQRVAATVDLAEAEWERVLAVNITGVFLCSKYVAREMMRRDSGKIINISSVNGVSGRPLVAAYNASKWAVLGFTKTLAVELAPYQVNVNAICPGPVDAPPTEFQEAHAAERAALMGISAADVREQLRQATPLGRLARPSDIGAAAAFLASEDSAHITGEYLIVSGGLSDVTGPAPRRRPSG
ncbi:MAG: hypothetical protein CL878_14325 [Dehalococcoidia bacterium]|nr:hypothetical protein [Dehalococcoidia bacterium]